jgi:hypothetical protein
VLVQADRVPAAATDGPKTFMDAAPPTARRMKLTFTNPTTKRSSIFQSWSRSTRRVDYSAFATSAADLRFFDRRRAASRIERWDRRALDHLGARAADRRRLEHRLHVDAVR